MRTPHTRVMRGRNGLKGGKWKVTIVTHPLPLFAQVFIPGALQDGLSGPGEPFFDRGRLRGKGSLDGQKDESGAGENRYVAQSADQWLTAACGRGFPNDMRECSILSCD